MNQLKLYMRYTAFILGILILMNIEGIAQKNLFSKNKREVTVTYPDSTVKAEIRTKKKRISCKDAVEYYWFFSDQIHKNLGSYTGNLLYGNYQVFSLDKKLITEGCFHKGVKNGNWKKWNPKTGYCISENWKNGKKNGYTTTFSNEGKIVSKVQYKNGLRHGTATYFQNDSIIKKIYRHDKIYEPAPKQKKTNCFKKLITKIKTKKQDAPEKKEKNNPGFLKKLKEKLFRKKTETDSK